MTSPYGECHVQFKLVMLEYERYNGCYSVFAVFLSRCVGRIHPQ